MWWVIISGALHIQVSLGSFFLFLPFSHAPYRFGSAGRGHGRGYSFATGSLAPLDRLERSREPNLLNKTGSFLNDCVSLVGGKSGR
jgi:hypothetical protein